MEKVTLLNQRHLSTTDWDFIKESDWSPWTDWLLHHFIFVSPPTCLIFRCNWIMPRVMFLCNLPATLDMKAGRFITWYQRQAYGVGHAHIVIGVTGPGSPGIQLGLWTSDTQFLRTRQTWWQGIDPAGNPKTINIYDRWISGQWVYVDTFYLPPLTGNVNRVGVVAWPQSLGRDHYFDDTEIWRQL